MHLLKIIKIRQCLVMLQLKMYGILFTTLYEGQSKSFAIQYDRLNVEKF